MEAIWDTAKRLPIRVVMPVELPTVPGLRSPRLVQYAIQTLIRAARRAAGDSVETLGRFGPPAPELIMCNNKVLRPIPRFSAGVPVPVT
jgi:hypothetical protein